MRLTCWRAGTLAIGLAAASVGEAPSYGQAPPAASAPAPQADAGAAALERALQETQRAGKPTVIVATSQSAAGSQSFYREVRALLEVRKACQGVMLVELPAEGVPDLARRLAVASYPAILAFRQGALVPELTGRKEGLPNASVAVDYLCSLGLEAGSERLLDTKVVRAGLLHHDVQPSGQAPAPVAPPVAPPAQPQPQPQQMTPVLAAPVVAAPASPPVTVAAAAPSIVFQQQPPNIYVAPPAQPANIQILAPPPAAPNVSVLQPAASPAQMFLPAAAPVAAPTMVAAPATAPAVSAPAAAPMAAIPPCFLGRWIGNFGERLTRFKYPRVPATTTTMLAQPAPVAPLAAVPAALAPLAVPAAPAVPYSPPVAPTAPAPSPQGSQPASQGHGLFHHGGF